MPETLELGRGSRRPVAESPMVLRPMGHGRMHETHRRKPTWPERAVNNEGLGVRRWVH
jgi:hypothetical protein